MESIEITVDAADVELASDVMWAAGVAGIEERDAGAGKVLLIAGVEPAAIDDVAAALSPRWEVWRGRLEPELWADAWRAYARATRLAPGLVVQPPWVDPIAEPGDVVLSLDPGRAWGHGAHPSTVAAAQSILDLQPLSGVEALDVGCGGGLLALVAATGGCRRVVAIDVDPAAVEATLANAAVNGLDGVIEASTTPIGLVDGVFGVVVANIGLSMLTSIVAAVSTRVDSRGALVLSGLLDEQVDAAVAAYAPMHESARRSLDGWTAVTLRPVARRS